MPIASKENSGSSSASLHKNEGSDKLKANANQVPLSKAIQQARMAKKMSQKDLASKVNVKVQLMGDYESGKTIPNSQIISKIEKVLDVKLRSGSNVTKNSTQGGSSKCGVAKVGPLKIED